MTLSSFLKRLSLTAAVLAFSAAHASAPAVLVVAQDRGFMGNQEARDALASVDAINKAIVFITDEDSRKYLDAAVTALAAGDTEALAVLPYFVSGSHPGWLMARSWLENDVCNAQFACTFSKPFGRSYYAVDVLDQVLGTIESSGDKKLVILGSGSDSDESAADMAADWRHLAMSTDAARTFAEVATFIWDSRDDAGQSDALKALADRQDIVVVSYNFGWKFDSMMSLDAMLMRRIARDVAGEVLIAGIPVGVGGMWMQREVNRNLVRGPQDVGVVVHAHGSTFHWNETMRNAVAPLHDKYAVEYAFSMADRLSIESALQRLEQRGVRAAVVVRVFGREDSFRSTIEKQLGIDVEKREPGHRHHGAHGGGHMMMSAGRIHTPLLVTSTGGLGDHPLFAEGLLARTLEISVDPSRETVILVAHGIGDDKVNDYWISLLESLAAKMRALPGGGRFRAIEVATWREDWPDKREEWIAYVRDLVANAQADGGRALVIPARTNSGGPEDEFLAGLDYVLGKGFAPHPLFTEWLDTQIMDGVRALTNNLAQIVAHDGD